MRRRSSRPATSWRTSAARRRSTSLRVTGMRAPSCSARRISTGLTRSSMASCTSPVRPPPRSEVGTFFSFRSRTVTRAPRDWRSRSNSSWKDVSAQPSNFRQPTSGASYVPRKATGALMRPPAKRTPVRVPSASGRSWTRLSHFFPSPPFDRGKLGGSGREATATSREFRNSSLNTTTTSPAGLTRSARATRDGGDENVNETLSSMTNAFISEPAADDVVEAEEADAAAVFGDDGEDGDLRGAVLHQSEGGVREQVGGDDDGRARHEAFGRQTRQVFEPHALQGPPHVAVRHDAREPPAAVEHVDRTQAPAADGL